MISRLSAIPDRDSSESQVLHVFGHIFFVSSNLQNSFLQKSWKISSSWQALTLKLTRNKNIKNFIFGMSLIWRVESDNWKIRGFDFASGWNHDVIPTPQITYDYPYHIHNHKQITPLSYTLRHSKGCQFSHFFTILEEKSASFRRILVFPENLGIRNVFLVIA